VERYFQHGLARQFAEQHPRQCPTVLGIDDHFFTRRQGFATTLCDLRNPKIYDVVLGRSEAALRSYLQRLEGQTSRQSGVHGSVLDGIVRWWRNTFPTPSSWPTASTSFASLMRRHRFRLQPEQRQKLEEYLAAHPALAVICRFKQQLCYLLLTKASHPEAVRSADPSLAARSGATQAGRPGSAGGFGADPLHLAPGDCSHVAVYPRQRHHRGLPYQNGSPH
jgi:hypothetical protein